MDLSPVTKKLKIKENHRVCIVSAPEHYVDSLHPLPLDVTIDTELKGQYDIIQIFVKWQKDLADVAQNIKEHTNKGTAIWFCYPKGTAKVETDLTRDRGWENIKDQGMTPCAMFSIDEVWSALRFKYV